MKVLKYTFTIPNLIIENGELVDHGFREETHTFTLLFKGVGLYEKLSGGHSLLTDLAKMGNGTEEGFIDRLDMNVVKNLAKASYCKIENGAFHNNVTTAEDFAKTDAFNRIGIDTEFIVALLEMCVDCCTGTKPAKESANGKK